MAGRAIAWLQEPGRYHGQEAGPGTAHLFGLRTPASPLRRLPEQDMLRALVRGVLGEPDGPSAAGGRDGPQDAVR